MSDNSNLDGSSSSSLFDYNQQEQVNMDDSLDLSKTNVTRLIDLLKQSDHNITPQMIKSYMAMNFRITPSQKEIIEKGDLKSLFVSQLTQKIINHKDLKSNSLNSKEGSNDTDNISDQSQQSTHLDPVVLLSKQNQPRIQQKQQQNQKQNQDNGDNSYLSVKQLNVEIEHINSILSQQDEQANLDYISKRIEDKFNNNQELQTNIIQNKELPQNIDQKRIKKHNSPQKQLKKVNINDEVSDLHETKKELLLQQNEKLKAWRPTSISKTSQKLTKSAVNEEQQKQQQKCQLKVKALNNLKQQQLILKNIQQKKLEKPNSSITDKQDEQVEVNKKILQINKNNTKYSKQQQLNDKLAQSQDTKQLEDNQQMVKYEQQQIEQFEIKNDNSKQVDEANMRQLEYQIQNNNIKQQKLQQIQKQNLKNLKPSVKQKTNEPINQDEKISQLYEQQQTLNTNIKLKIQNNENIKQRSISLPTIQTSSVQKYIPLEIVNDQILELNKQHLQKYKSFSQNKKTMYSEVLQKSLNNTDRSNDDMPQIELENKDINLQSQILINLEQDQQTFNSYLMQTVYNNPENQNDVGYNFYIAHMQQKVLNVLVKIFKEHQSQNSNKLQQLQQKYKNYVLKKVVKLKLQTFQMILQKYNFVVQQRKQQNNNKIQLLKIQELEKQDIEYSVLYNESKIQQRFFVKIILQYNYLTNKQYQCIQSNLMFKQLNLFNLLKKSCQIENYTKLIIQRIHFNRIKLQYKLVLLKYKNNQSIKQKIFKIFVTVALQQIKKWQPSDTRYVENIYKLEKIIQNKDNGKNIVEKKHNLCDQQTTKTFKTTEFNVNENKDNYQYVKQYIQNQDEREQQNEFYDNLQQRYIQESEQEASQQCVQSEQEFVDEENNQLQNYQQIQNINDDIQSFNQNNINYDQQKEQQLSKIITQQKELAAQYVKEISSLLVDEDKPYLEDEYEEQQCIQIQIDKKDVIQHKTVQNTQKQETQQKVAESQSVKHKLTIIKNSLTQLQEHVNQNQRLSTYSKEEPKQQQSFEQNQQYLTQYKKPNIFINNINLQPNINQYQNKQSQKQQLVFNNLQKQQFDLKQQLNEINKCFNKNIISSKKHKQQMQVLDDNLHDNSKQLLTNIHATDYHIKTCFKQWYIITLKKLKYKNNNNLALQYYNQNLMRKVLQLLNYEQQKSNHYHVVIQKCQKMITLHKKRVFFQKFALCCYYQRVEKLKQSYLIKQHQIALKSKVFTYICDQYQKIQNVQKCRKFKLLLNKNNTHLKQTVFNQMIENTQQYKQHQKIVNNYVKQKQLTKLFTIFKIMVSDGCNSNFCRVLVDECIDNSLLNAVQYSNQLLQQQLSNQTKQIGSWIDIQCPCYRNSFQIWRNKLNKQQQYFKNFIQTKNVEQKQLKTKIFQILKLNYKEVQLKQFQDNKLKQQALKQILINFYNNQRLEQNKNEIHTRINNINKSELLQFMQRYTKQQKLFKLYFNIINNKHTKNLQRNAFELLQQNLKVARKLQNIHQCIVNRQNFYLKFKFLYRLVYLHKAGQHNNLRLNLKIINQLGQLSSNFIQFKFIFKQDKFQFQIGEVIQIFNIITQQSDKNKLNQFQEKKRQIEEKHVQIRVDNSQQEQYDDYINQSVDLNNSSQIQSKFALGLSQKLNNENVMLKSYYLPNQTSLIQHKLTELRQQLNTQEDKENSAGQDKLKIDEQQNSLFDTQALCQTNTEVKEKLKQLNESNDDNNVKLLNKLSIQQQYEQNEQLYGSIFKSSNKNDHDNTDEQQEQNTNIDRKLENLNNSLSRLLQYSLI